MKQKIMYLLLLLVSSSAFSQVLHHQMIASQGGVIRIKGGVIVSQSIGQLSVSGTYSKDGLIVQQGFQQNSVFKPGEVIPYDDGITTIIYPNPFMDNIKLEFSSEIKGFFEIQLADMSGKILVRDRKLANQNILTIESLGHLPRGSYVLSVVASNYKFVVLIIKK